MAYTMALTMAEMADVVLKMIGFLKTGGTAGADELTEAYWAINTAVKSLDGAGWFRQNINQAAGQVNAGNNYTTLDAQTVDVVAAFTYEASGGEVGMPLIVTSPEECLKHGPLYATGIPSHGWLNTAEVAINTQPRLYVNRRPDENRTVIYFYREQTELMATAGAAFTLPDEFLFVVCYMAAVQLARMHKLSLELKGELQQNLNLFMEMMITGQYVLDPSVVPDLLAQVGQGPQTQGG